MVVLPARIVESVIQMRPDANALQFAHKFPSFAQNRLVSGVLVQHRYDDNLKRSNSWRQHKTTVVTMNHDQHT